MWTQAVGFLNKLKKERTGKKVDVEVLDGAIDDDVCNFIIHFINSIPHLFIYYCDTVCLEFNIYPPRRVLRGSVIATRTAGILV